MEERFSKIGFILAGLGSAVGLGNIWRFPYVASRYGFEFIVAYLLIAVSLGIPLLIGEISLGRQHFGNIVHPFRSVFKRFGLLVSLFVVGTQVWVASYYAPLTAVTLGYALSDPFNYPDLNIFSSSAFMLTLFVLVSLAAVYVVHLGIKKGIEEVVQVFMPIFFFLLLGLFLYVVFILNGIQWIYSVKFNIENFLNSKMWLDAIGQAIFSLSAGMGIMLVYGSHMRKRQSIINSVFLIFLGDTLAALFSYGIVNSVAHYLGTSAYSTLDLTFSMLSSIPFVMPLGWLITFVFFTLMFMAAYTSLISMIEVPHAFLSDMRVREKTLYVAFFLLLIGFVLLKKGLLVFADNLASYLLPISGMIISSTAGRDVACLERAVKSKRTAKVISFFLKYLIPFAILLLLLFSV